MVKGVPFKIDNDTVEWFSKKNELAEAMITICGVEERSIIEIADNSLFILGREEDLLTFDPNIVRQTKRVAYNQLLKILN